MNSLNKMEDREVERTLESAETCDIFDIRWDRGNGEQGGEYICLGEDYGGIIFKRYQKGLTPDNYGHFARLNFSSLDIQNLLLSINLFS
mgnify:CR=1 FL=1